MHEDAPGPPSLYLPASHEIQTLDVCPVWALYFPAMQLMQIPEELLPDPLPLAYFPAVHGRQTATLVWLDPEVL